MKKTIRLEDEIVRISQNNSSLKAAKVLKKNIVTVGKSTICNILKKEPLSIKKDQIKKVCIDDLALKNMLH